MTFKNILMIVSLLMFPTVVLSQSLYKWFDDQGQVHFTSEPPVDRSPQEIRMHKKSTEEQSQYVKERAAQLKESRVMQAAEKEKQQKLNEAEKKINAEKCSKAESELSFLKNKSHGLRIYKDDGIEPRRYISDTERAQSIDYWLQQVNDSCDN